jgi:hypothetical protein
LAALLIGGFNKLLPIAGNQHCCQETECSRKDIKQDTPAVLLHGHHYYIFERLF